MAAISIIASYLSYGVLAVVFLLTMLYLYSLHRFTYWRNKGMAYIPGSFPFGSLRDVILQKVGLVELFADLYNKIEGKYIGYYSFINPQLLIKDLGIIKDVLVKDFGDFTNRGVYHNKKVDPLSCNLFTIEGASWKLLRGKLSPVFTSGKMKTMYSIMKDCANDLQNYGSQFVGENDIVDFKDMITRYGLEVISNTTLGFKSNNFVDDNSEMKYAATLFTSPTPMQMCRLTFTLLCKSLAKIFRMRFTPKGSEKYFVRTVKEMREYRENHNVRRNDFLQLLIDMNHSEENKGDASKNEPKFHLSINEMASQSFTFVTAGFETTSVAIGFCLYELALNPEIQEKLFVELDNTEEDISYETLHKLPYLDMVLNETLRKYPPLAYLQRECSRDYQLPDGKVIDKGTLVIISVIGLHRDPTLFPDPDKFDPERFNKDNLANIRPYSYLPFGEGPRNCIGMRFGKMQAKLALISLLSRFRVEVCQKTSIPIKIEKRTFLFNAEGGMWLRLKKRK